MKTLKDYIIMEGTFGYGPYDSDGFADSRYEIYNMIFDDITKRFKDVKDNYAGHLWDNIGLALYYTTLLANSKEGLGNTDSFKAMDEQVINAFSIIENDAEIDVVVEAMGGLTPAYDFVKRSLLRGKNVVTSNKELVAEKGVELLSIAQLKGVKFLFEASVGGGIPIIRPLYSSLTSDEISGVYGILNGTTNYILTRMINDGVEFSEVLLLCLWERYAGQCDGCV